MIFGAQFTHLCAMGLGTMAADTASYMDITRVPDLSAMWMLGSKYDDALACSPPDMRDGCRTRCFLYLGFHQRPHCVC